MFNVYVRLTWTNGARCEDRREQAHKESSKAKAEKSNSVSRRATHSCSPSLLCDITAAGKWPNSWGLEPVGEGGR